MDDGLFKGKYRIASCRLPYQNYEVGCFFVTICAKDMVHYFGRIVDGKMLLTPVGKAADDLIAAMPQRYERVEVIAHVVMPNHVHLMLRIHAKMCCDDGATTPVATDTPAKNEHMQTIATNVGELSKVINHYKGNVTKYAKANGIPFAWQSGFYDEIVRDDAAYNAIKRYIETNVIRWKK